MGELEFLEYRVLVSRDPDTGQLLAEVPSLGLVDYGTDLPDALKHLEEMLRFHLDCLQEEGKSIPTEQRRTRGFTFD
jgi:predicted RNase H-like HicB family nuclease